MNQPRSVQDPPLLGVDSMAFIYHFEDNDEHGSAATGLLQAAEESRCRLVASILTRLEVLVLPKRQGREDLCRRYREVFEQFPNLEIPAIDSTVVEIASDLRAVHNLRTPDALHLATAIDQGASGFVTEDRRHFPATVGELPILTLREALARIPAGT